MDDEDEGADENERPLSREGLAPEMGGEKKGEGAAG